MSGAHHVGTGENAHGWADALGECEGLEVRFPRPLEPHAAALMKTLGVRIIIDPHASAWCCTIPSGVPGLTRTERRRLGLPVWDPIARTFA